MGKQIDADKLIEHFVNKTANGWLVPICENESRWSLEGIISEIKYFKPTVEAVPKADYEARLKTDMVAMLEEIKDQAKKLMVQKARENVFGREFKIEDYDDIIQSKIDKLKGE